MHVCLIKIHALTPFLPYSISTPFPTQYKPTPSPLSVLIPAEASVGPTKGGDEETINHDASSSESGW
jgi:hypothetical protein